MLEVLAQQPKVIGVKQSAKVLKCDLATQAFFARNADPLLLEPLVELCEQKRIPYVRVETMSELGQACGIEVGAAVAVVLKNDC